MARQTTSNTAPPTAVVWADGALYVDEPLPDDVSTLLGVELGISPATHVHGPTFVGAHVRVLAVAASVLGYDGFDAAAVRDQLLAVPEGATVTVSLVPTPDSHRAMPPGTSWTLHVEPADAADLTDSGLVEPRTEGLRVALGPFRRNPTGDAAAILLRDDTESWAGTVHDPSVDATLWLDLEGRVACIDRHCLVVRLDGRLVTPPLDHGAFRTPPRHVLVTSAGDPIDGPVVERGLTRRDLLDASAVACVTPWGGVLPVAVLDGHTYDTAAGADLVDALAQLLAEGAR